MLKDSGGRVQAKGVSPSHDQPAGKLGFPLSGKMEVV